MTPAEFIAHYDKLASEARDISLQIKPFTDRLDDIEAEQCELSKTPEILESITPLRAGQIIATALHHKDGSVEWSVAHVVAVCGVHLTYHGPADGLEVYIKVRRDGACGVQQPCYVMLHPQPGRQWRYPTDSTPAAVAGTERTLP
jgi:hypothetical protein